MFTKRAWPSFSWLLLISLMHLCPTLSFGQNFTAQGEGTFSLSSKNEGEERKESRFAFKAEVDGARWRIETYSLTRTNPGAFHYIDYSDGSNVSSTIVTLTNGIIKAASETLDLGNGLLESSAYSLTPWLGLCSSLFFSTNHSTSPSFWQRDSLLKAAEPFPILLKSQDKPFGLPLALLIYHPGYELTRNQKGEVIKTTCLEPYNKGYRRLAFEITSSTNIGGFDLPRVMRSEEFVPMPNGQSTNDLISIKLVTATVTNYTLGNASPQYPYPGFNRSVLDRRFTLSEWAVRSIEYRHSGNTFLPMDDPALIAKVKAASTLKKK